MNFKDKGKSNVYDSIAGYDLYAPFYDKTLAYLNTFEQQKLLEMIPNLKGKKVLDIGCGTGRIYKELQFLGKDELDLTGVDSSKEMLKIARKKFPHFKFVNADAVNLPFKAESFDVVLATFLIVHLKGLDAFFEEVYRVLRPGGIFIVTNINQRKAPKLKYNDKEIVIKSFYHMPPHVREMLGKQSFRILDENFTYEGKNWITQILKVEK